MAKVQSPMVNHRDMESVEVHRRNVMNWLIVPWCVLHQYVRNGR